MPKITLYFPENLQKEAEKYGGYNINFSQVFQEALQEKIDQIKRLEELEGADMEKTVKRMRYELGPERKEAYQLGFNVGKEWGMKNAGYKELRDVATGKLWYGKVEEPEIIDDIIEVYKSEENEHLFEISEFEEGFEAGAAAVLEKVKEEI